MKYVLVTGGVVSGLGKGVTASSIGLLLKACGLRVTSIKIGLFLFYSSLSFHLPHLCFWNHFTLASLQMLLNFTLYYSSPRHFIFSYLPITFASFQIVGHSELSSILVMYICIFFLGVGGIEATSYIFCFSIIRKVTKGDRLLLLLHLLSSYQTFQHQLSCVSSTSTWLPVKFSLYKHTIATSCN